METVVPWSLQETLNRPFYPKNRNGSLPIPLGMMLCIHFMQQWFGYSNPAMEKVLQALLLLRKFSGLDTFEDVMPDERQSLRFRHLLQRHDQAVASFLRSIAYCRRKFC